LISTCFTVVDKSNSISVSAEISDKAQPMPSDWVCVCIGRYFHANLAFLLLICSIRWDCGKSWNL